MMLNINFTDGLVFSLISILVVLLIIALIIISIWPLKLLSPQQVIEAPKVLTKKTLTEDMVVAVLVASIDFKESQALTPKLISIKEITDESI